MWDGLAASRAAQLGHSKDGPTWKTLQGYSAVICPHGWCWMSGKGSSPRGWWGTEQAPQIMDMAPRLQEIQKCPVQGQELVWMVLCESIPRIFSDSPQIFCQAAPRGAHSWSIWRRKQPEQLGTKAAVGCSLGMGCVCPVSACAGLGYCCG